MSTRHPPIRLALALLLCVACAPPGRSPGGVAIDTGVPGLVPSAWDTGTVTAEGLRVPVECPGLHAKAVPDPRSAAPRDPAVAARLAASMQHVPKYHDCQRLVIGNSANAYGPLVAIFALESLRPIDAAALSQPGGAPVALIRNLSSDRYRPLSIDLRFSCLHLRMTSPDSFDALIEWRDADSTCVPLSAAAWQGVGTLRVRPTRPASEPAHYPPVARWDRDRPNGQHLIGIKCLDMWCEIGRGAFVPSPGLPHPQHTGRVKGWYDEQWLAEVTTSPPTMKPGVRAWIVPEPGLDTLKIEHFSTCDSFPCEEQAGWVHVSTAWLDGPSRSYKRLMNLEEGTRGNTIHARRQVNPEGVERWESRITSATGEVRYYRTHRMAHPDAYVPPVARWLWRDDDETSWFRCDVGCCETSQERIMNITEPF